MIEVYHGSFMEIRKPDISFSRQTLDFGKGFYVTPLREQAVRWALRWQRRGKTAIVSTYSFDDSSGALAGLRVKDFPEYDSSWLHFIMAKYDSSWLRFIMENRSGQASESYDIIRGGVANDKVFNTLELFFDGLISEEEALGRLKFEKPNHQICICRQDLMDRLLVFQSSEEVSDGSQ